MNPTPQSQAAIYLIFGWGLTIAAVFSAIRGETSIAVILVIPGFILGYKGYKILPDPAPKAPKVPKPVAADRLLESNIKLIRKAFNYHAYVPSLSKYVTIIIALGVPKDQASNDRFELAEIAMKSALSKTAATYTSFSTNSADGLQPKILAALISELDGAGAFSFFDLRIQAFDFTTEKPREDRFSNAEPEAPNI